jgi:hypothetical protein
MQKPIEQMTTQELIEYNKKLDLKIGEILQSITDSLIITTERLKNITNVFKEMGIKNV